MQSAKRFTSGWMFLGATIALLGLFSAVPVRVHAQEGYNAIFKSSTGCLSGGCTPSAAFIDASVFTGSDFCQKVNNALNSMTSSQAVIDARGIHLSGGNTCADSPFITPNTINKPSSILLPSGTITISKIWILPNGTRIIGEGGGASGASLTTLQAASSFTGTWMIQMGPNSSNPPLTACPSTGCIGVSVEDLTLQGSTGVSGIINGRSQESSYVRRVNMYQIPGTGLKVWNLAQNSGPYSDIRFDTTGATTSATGTQCAQVLGVPTRGIHGLTCISNTVPNAAVLLDGSNNSIEDVNVSGFIDGVLVGQNAAAQSNVLLNVANALEPGVSGTVTNLIHISNATAGNVTDLSILSATNLGSTNTIKDDVTSTTLARSTDAYVGMYVLGDAVLAAGSPVGYSRFSTSPRIPTWAVEKTTISTTPPGPCATGSILSNPGASGSANTLWACTGGTWANIQ
jgi:hypothetical protein